MMDDENPVQLISVCSGMGRNLGMTDRSMVTRSHYQLMIHKIFEIPKYQFFMCVFFLNIGWSFHELGDWLIYNIL